MEDKKPPEGIRKTGHEYGVYVHQASYDLITDLERRGWRISDSTVYPDYMWCKTRDGKLAETTREALSLSLAEA